MAQTERTAAVLLRSIAYGESDRIVTLLTESRGKISLMARGARRSARRFSGSLEPYALIEAEIALGRGDLGRLAEARVVRVFPGVLADLTKMSVAAAGLELVRESIGDRDEPDPRLLPTVVRFFEIVERSSAEEVVLAFEARLLSLTGLSPNLQSCGRCDRAAPPGKAALFDPASGALACRACGGGPVKLSGGLRSALVRAGGREWDTVALEPLGDVDRIAARRAFDAFFERHLGKRLAGADMVSQVREVAAAYGRAGSET